MNALQVNQISVIVNGIKLLDNISFSLAGGQIMVAIGPNGAGKSTLLKTIIGDIPIDSGEITINNHSVSSGQLASDQARYCAMLPQFSLLNFPYRVTEVVALGRIPHKTGAVIDQQIIKESLSAMDMLPSADKLYTQLSGGEKQRVQIARVLAQVWRAEDLSQTRLLILDEPTIALDLGHQKLLFNCLRQMARQKVAILMVLHDLNVAAAVADYLLAIKQGTLLMCDKAEKVITIECLQTLFDTKTRIIRDPENDNPIVIND